MQITIKKVQQKLPVSESDITQNPHKYKPASMLPMQAVLSILDALYCVPTQAVAWYCDSYSCHPMSHSKKEGAGFETVKSELITIKHYVLYTLLGSHNFKSKLVNKSSVAGIRGHAIDSAAEMAN